MRKKVLITGSSHGIGEAAAIAFAENGYDVGINCYKNPELAEAVAEQVRKRGAMAEVFPCDVADSAAVEKMMNGFIEKFGHIDVLVNNAGGALKMPQGGFEEMPVEYWDYQLKLNLSHAAYTSRIAMKNMIENKIHGKIINISSVHSIVTYVRRKTLPYCAAKAGLNMFTKALGVEAIKYGINVNAIAPGFISTKATTRYDEGELRAFLRKIPAGRLGSVEDVVPMILFLADDVKAKFIVGQTFVIDGGQSIDGAIDYMLDKEI
ncbi:MAG: SDR family NAD(P)-dependent oxidoreductase [Candidatus Gallimonas sp.]